MTPRAGRHAIAGVRDDTLLVRLAAAPVEGAANAALLELFADALDVPRRDVHLVSGDRSRHKRVAIRGHAAATLNDRLTRLLKSRDDTGRL